MRPQASRVLATRFSSCALSEMRAVTAIASPPLSRIAAATSSHGAGIARRDHDPAAGLGKRLGDRPADAAARPGHDRDLAGQIEQVHRAL